MMYLSKSLIVVLLFVASSFAQLDVEFVSMINLIATPEKYHGKKVMVEGFLHVQFEDNVIYMHKDDGDYLMGKNGLWVSYAKEPSLEPLCEKQFAALARKLTYFNGRYVLIRGTFNMERKGHMGATSGTIEEVTRVLEQRRWFDGQKSVVTMDKNGRMQDICEENTNKTHLRENVKTLKP